MKRPVSLVAVCWMLLLALVAENYQLLAQEATDPGSLETLLGTWREFPDPEVFEAHELELSRFIWRTEEFGHLCNFGYFGWTFSSDGTAESEAVSAACRGYGRDGDTDVLIGSDGWTYAYAYEFENGVLEARPDYEPTTGTSCKITFLNAGLMFMSDCRDFVDHEDGSREWQEYRNDRLLWKRDTDDDL